MTKTTLKVMLAVEEIVAVIAYAAMFLLIFAEIVSRQLWGGSLTGSEIVATLASVVAGFVGFSLVTHSGSHLRATFLDGIAPERFQGTVGRLGHLVSLIVLSGLAYLAFMFIQESVQYGEQVEILYWPLWPFQAVIFYGLAASALKSLLFFIDPDCAPQRATAH